MDTKAFDSIALVEAFYSEGWDTQAWLENIADALRPLDRSDLGVYARIDDHRGPGPVQVTACAVRAPIPKNFAELVDRGHAEATQEVMRSLYAPSPMVGSAGARIRHLGAAAALYYAWRRMLGMPEVLGVNALDPTGLMLHFGVVVDARYRMAPRLRHQLTLVAAHGLAGLRLRLALTEAGAREPATEAVLDAAGRVCDATGAAQSKTARLSLSQAVQRMELARGKRRRTEPEEALALWQGLVDGRWSLVDHHDADGRRYILVRRNDPAVRDPKALTARERAVVAFAAQGHQNKHIGYLLGLAPTTVASHLTVAMRKLGVPTRRELIQMFLRLGSEPAGES